MEQSDGQIPNRSHPKIQPPPHCFNGAKIVGKHPRMLELLELVEQVADTDATVLIVGETGTGKELIANALHQKSNRWGKPFVPVNCAALPEHLLESELFGHVRGAYTGAVEDKPGWFECADQGTIFLDEINDMPLPLQLRLLRILQSNCYSRVGSRQIRHCNVRVVAAANRDIRQLVAAGHFREELYFRLNLIELHIPPLRERKSDIPMLASYFLHLFGKKHQKQQLHLSRAAKKLLLAHDYSGNVRELENIVHGAILLAKEHVIQPCHLPVHVHRHQVCNNGKWLPFQMAKKRNIEQFETDYLCNCLRASHGNITQAAQMAGLHVSNFHHKMKQHHINAAAFKS